MKSIARFITRPTEPHVEGSSPDKILGAFMKSQDEFESNCVYEIYEDFTGALQIRKVGESWLDPSEWNQEYQHVLSNNGNELLLSGDEREEFYK